MQYIKFLISLWQQHKREYRRFKLWQPYIQSVIELNHRRSMQPNKNYKRPYKTLKEITQSNREFEQSHPELFPGLFKDNN